MSNPDLNEVTKEAFFAALSADPRDIMPTIVNATHPYRSEWRDQKGSSRALFGESYDGHYWLMERS